MTSESLQGESCTLGLREGPGDRARAPTLTSKRKVLGLGTLLAMVRLPESALRIKVPSSFPGGMQAGWAGPLPRPAVQGPSWLCPRGGGSGSGA